jgi:hypothetical protein
MDWKDLKRTQEEQKLLNDPAVREVLKQRERLHNTGVTFAGLNEQAALVKELSSIDPYKVNLKPLLDAVAILRRPLPPEWVQARQHFVDFSHKFAHGIDELRATLEVTRNPLRNFVQQWQETNRLLNEVVSKAPTDSLLGLMTRQATDVYKANARRIERGLTKELLSSNPALAAQFFVPIISYLDFSQRTMSRIAESGDPAQRAALGGSLVIAEEHVTDATRLIIDVEAEEQDATESQMSTPQTEYPIYEVVQLDLIDVGDLPPEATYSVLVRFSSAATLAELTRQTLSAVLRCNKTGKLGARQEIFKATTLAQEALVALPGLVVRDESSLRDFITHLYILIYEGAGDQKLRFLKENGGPMERDECDAVWNLKALRNKWLIHDPEHGDDKAILKSYRSLAEALKNLGLNSFPSAKRDFEELQRKVLNALLAFHSELEARIASP